MDVCDECETDDDLFIDCICGKCGIYVDDGFSCYSLQIAKKNVIESGLIKDAFAISEYDEGQDAVVFLEEKFIRCQHTGDLFTGNFKTKGESK